jgi:hypothetical protein
MCSNTALLELFFAFTILLTLYFFYNLVPIFSL